MEPSFFPSSAQSTGVSNSPEWEAISYLIHPRADNAILTIGLPSIFPGNSGPNISLADNPTPHKYCSRDTIPRVHWHVLRRLHCHPSRMGYPHPPCPHQIGHRMCTNGVLAPPWYNGYRFVLTFIVCTSIVFNLIVKEYLQDTGSTHGKLVDLKSARQNIKGIEFGDKVEESAKHKYVPTLSLTSDGGV